MADDGTNGVELWKTDGSVSGTSLLKIINPTQSPSVNPNNNFIVFNNNFYFFANNGTTGFELWKSDGTTNGTQLLKDIRPGSNSSNTKMIGGSTANYFAFAASTQQNGNELWKSDGTAAGTMIVKDLDSSTSSSLNYNTEIVTFNDKIYFIAAKGTFEDELWSSDGTAAGTQIVKDIKAGNNYCSITKLTPTTNFLIFSAKNDLNAPSPWKSDGTFLGTSKVKDIDLSQTSDTQLDFIELNGAIFFSGGRNSLNGIELWKTDGTPNNTSLVKDMSHRISFNYDNTEFISFNDKVIYIANDGIHGKEPFITDGTIDGTKMIKDIFPGEYSSIYNSNDGRPSFTKAGNYVYFRAYDASSGYELFKTDGTEAGTSLVKNIAPGGAASIGVYTFFMSFNDLVLFKANDQVHGEELWRSDGTEQGTYMLKDINPSALNGVTTTNIFENHRSIDNTRGYAILNGYLYFIGTDTVGHGIWKTDGTVNGTTKVMPISSSLGQPILLNSANGKVFFTTNTATNPSWTNNSLWSTDGTEAGTMLLGTYYTDEQFERVTVFNNELYFSSLGYINGIWYPRALMKSDGTPNGTLPVTPINFSNYEFVTLKPCGSFLYFFMGYQSSDGSYKELWRTNGTLSGTTMLQNSLESTGNCDCIQNNLVYTKKYFSDQIWYINDSMQTPDYFETNILNSVNFSAYEGINDIINLNGNILFSGSTNISGNELYSANVGNLLSTEVFDIDRNIANKVSVYPNPSNGIFNFSTSDKSHVTDISVYDLSGKIIVDSQRPVSADLIDLSKLLSGIYIMKITTETFSETKKIVIK